MATPVAAIALTNPSPVSPGQPVRPAPAAGSTPPVHKPAPAPPIEDTVKLSQAIQAQILKASGETVNQIAGTLGLSEEMVTTILTPPRVPFLIQK